MGDELKPQASFLARRNAPPPPAAEGTPGPAAPAPGAPTAPPPAKGPARPSMTTADGSPLTSGMMPALAPKPIVPAAKLKAGGTAPPPAANNVSAIRPGFSPGALRGPANNSALISGPNPALGGGGPPMMHHTDAVGMSVKRQQQYEEMEVTRTETPRSRANPNARSEAEQTLQRGLDHYDRGEHEMAMAAYNEAIEIDPTFAMAYNNLGMVLIDLERYQDAMNALYESIRHDPNYGEAYNNLGFVLRRLGNNIEAVAAYQRFLDLEPEVEEGDRISSWIDTVLAENGLEVAPHLTLPDPVSSTGGFKPQRDEHQQDHEEEEPAEPPKIKKMAAWEAAAGDQEMAAPINALGGFDDDDVPASFTPKQGYTAPQPSYAPQPTSAPKAVGQVSQRQPVLPNVPTGGQLDEEKNRQVALIEKALDDFAGGRLDDALTVAKQAIDINMQNSEAHTVLGKILVRQEELKEGIEQLEMAIELAPDDPAPYYVLGFTLRAMERNVEAAEIYETYLRLMPDAIDAHKMRQWIMHVKGIAEAEAAPDRDDDNFIDNEPILTETDKMYAAALERFKASIHSATVDDCIRILTESPDHPRTRMLLGRAFMREGDFEKATEAFDSVLQLQPDCAEAMYFLGQAYERAGDSPHALKAYSRYVDTTPNGIRAEKLRAWFLSHGLSDTGRGLSQQVQCEWCLRFFPDDEISMHEGKATCNGCLTLMGSTPIQDANKLEAVDVLDSPTKSGRVERKSSGGIGKLAMIGGLAAAALVAVGYFTPYVDPYLKMVGITKKKPQISRPQPPLNPNPNPADTTKSPIATNPTTSTDATAINPNTNTNPKPDTVVTPLSANFDGTKVKISNAPERDFSVFSRWTWKPEFEGVEELNKSLPGWKKEFFFKDRPLGMNVEDGTIVWTSEPKDFDALKRGEKYTVDLTIKGYWIGPEGARKDLFSTSKTFTVASQFGYDVGPELDIGMAPEARNVELLGLDADGDGLRDVIVTYGSLTQGAIQTVLCGPDGLKKTITLADGARYSSACTFPLNGKENAGVLAANWQTGEVKLFLSKAGRLDAGPSVKFAPGTLSVAAMEAGKNKTAIAAFSSAAGILSISTYDAAGGFSKPATVAIPGGGGEGRVLPWNSSDLGAGFLVITPLAEEPLRFVPTSSVETEKGAAVVRSLIKDEGVITGAGRIFCTQTNSYRLALVMGGKTSFLMLLEEKAGKFSEVGTKSALPGPGLGMTVCDFNKDGNDDVFVVTRDEVCFYFLTENGGVIPGPHFPNPGMLGPVVLLGYGTSARPDIAVLNDNKKARIFKPVGAEPAAMPPAKASATQPNEGTGVGTAQ